MTTTRYAIVEGVTDAERIAPYLPGCYRIAGETPDGVIISGEDNAGWGLDTYVIPRLGSGLYFAREITEAEAKAVLPPPVPEPEPACKTFTADEFTAGLHEQYGPDAPAMAEQMNAWLARGDGVAVYVNHDLGHPELGGWRPVSFGSRRALLEVTTAAELPQRLPDTPKHINWRYQLEAVYRGESVTVDEHDSGCCPTCKGDATS